ncbi:MAG: DUF481 domain-containing protein [Pseudomonadales bacterium]|nr:DUF481 domain-containing protein [Pseudomonadales bacterium]MBO7004623.1 DUF481 domain-containing protein [Pseudomonadales bacterium]
MSRLVFFLVTVFLSFLAIAEEEPKFWSTDVELGAVFTSGNTEQESLKFRIDSKREKDVWVNSFHLDTFAASEDGNDTADKLYAFYRLDYKLADDRGLFTRLAYEDDQFSGFDHQTDLTFGYNQTLLERDRLKIVGDAGLGVRYFKVTDGDSETEALVRLAALLEWEISENALFKQALGFEIGEELTTTRSETSLETRVVGDLAMKLAVAVKHNSEVPAGKDKTDTESTVTLVYRF